jgi:hypothetical protein
MIKNLYLLFCFLLLSNLVLGQGYSYSYTDPCTKKLKSITIPPGQNQVAVNYYGNLKVFDANDFFNGNFGFWLNSISSSNPNGPCDEVRLALTKDLNMVVAQNVVVTIMNINSVTQALSASTSFSNLGNAVSNSEQEEKKDSKPKEPTQQSNRSTAGSSGSTSQQQENKTDTKTDSKSSETKTEDKKTDAPNTSQPTSVQNTGGNNVTPANGSTSAAPVGSQSTQSANTSGSGTKQTDQTNQTPAGTNSSGSSQQQSSTNKNNVQGNSGDKAPIEKKPEAPVQQDQNKDKSGFNSSNSAISNSISNAEDSESEEKEKKPGSKSKTGSIIGTGDIVLLKSAEDPNSRDQYRMTASFTRANTTNTRVWGILGNFTTQVNLSNITFYKAWVLPKSQWTIIGANSSMLNFERDAFNTSTLVASKKFKGNWKKLTAMGGLNFTTAKIGESSLNNLSAIGGGFFSYNIGKKVSGSILCLGVYSPFTHFYEGRWWESGTLLVPFNSWDYKISKTFKFNVSMSGIYEMKQSVLNYQILMGGKVLL